MATISLHKIRKWQHTIAIAKQLKNETWAKHGKTDKIVIGYIPAATNINKAIL